MKERVVIPREENPTIKPCPSCESSLGPYLDRIGGVAREHDPDKYDKIQQVICTTCGMRGPYNTELVDAVTLWNALSRKPA